MPDIARGNSWLSEPSDVAQRKLGLPLLCVQVLFFCSQIGESRMTVEVITDGPSDQQQDISTQREELRQIAESTKEFAKEVWRTASVCIVSENTAA